MTTPEQRLDYITAALDKRLSPTELGICLFLAFYLFDYETGAATISRARLGATLGRSEPHTIGKAANKLARQGFIWLDRAESDTGALDGPGTPFIFAARPMPVRQRPRLEIFALYGKRALELLRGGGLSLGAARTLLYLCQVAGANRLLDQSWKELQEAIPRRARASIDKDLAELERVGLLTASYYKPEGQRAGRLAIRLAELDEGEIQEPQLAEVPQAVIDAQELEASFRPLFEGL